MVISDDGLCLSLDVWCGGGGGWMLDVRCQAMDVGK